MAAGEMAAQLRGGRFPTAEGFSRGRQAGIEPERVEQTVRRKQIHVFEVCVHGVEERAAAQAHLGERKWLNLERQFFVRGRVIRQRVHHPRGRYESAECAGWQNGRGTRSRGGSGSGLQHFPARGFFLQNTLTVQGHDCAPSGMIFAYAFIRGTAPDPGSKSRKQCSRLDPAEQEYLSLDASFPEEAFEPTPGLRLPQ